MEFRIAIVGSRDFENYDLLKQKVEELMPKKNYDFIIVSGGAKGTDTLAERFAEEKGYKKEIHYAKWHLHGPCAGYLRNHAVVNDADMVIAFWNGISKGTRHVINIAKRDCNRVHVIRLDRLKKEEESGF